MKAVIKNLHEKSILHREQVIKIKGFIDKKYKDLPSSQKAQIFANAVHQIVDQSVHQFNESHRVKIRSEVLKTAVAKELFEISGYDVFEVCTLMENSETNNSDIKKNKDKVDFFRHLTDWINENQNIKVSIEDTYELSTDIIDTAINEVLDLLEDTSLSSLIDVEPDVLEAPKTEQQRVQEYIKNSMNSYSNPMEDKVLEEDKVTEEVRVTKQDNNDREDALDNSEDGRIIESNSPIEPKKLSAKDIEIALSEKKWVEEKVEPVNKVIHVSREKMVLNPPKIQVDKKTDIEKRVTIIAIFGTIMMIIIVLLIFGAFMVMNKNKQVNNSNENEILVIIEEPQSLALNIVQMEGNTSQDNLQRDEMGVNVNEGNHLDETLQYHDFNVEAIVVFLEKKNSILASDEYLEILIQVAKDYNVNPLLLIAIIGQEQAFVPKDHEYAVEIINNPFNVYGSWKDYNPGFEDSARIAARTILTASEERPKEIQAIEWINKTYAEDDNWHIGVTLIFQGLKEFMVDDFSG